MRGDGISASLLNAGVINTSLITVANGNTPSFHWDSYGISAFKWEVADGDQQAFDLSTFVRFDQFGLYGIKDKEVDWHPLNLQDVVNEAHFSITWDGFSLRTGDDSGIRITPENHFIIYKNLFDKNKLPLYDDDGNRMYLVKVKIGMFNEQYGNETLPITYQSYGMKVDSDGVIQLKQAFNTNTQNDPILEQRVLTFISGSLLNKKMTLDTEKQQEILLTGLINIHDSSTRSEYPVYSVGPTGAILSKTILTGVNLGLDRPEDNFNSSIGYIHTNNGIMVGLGADTFTIDNQSLTGIQIKIGNYNKNAANQYIRGMTEENIDIFRNINKAFKYGVNNSNTGYIVFPNSGYIKLIGNQFNFHSSNNSFAQIRALDAILTNSVTMENLKDSSNPYQTTIGANGTITINKRIESVTANGVDITYEDDSVIGRQTQIYSLDAEVVNSNKQLVVAGHGTFKNFYRNGKLRTGCFWYA